MKKLPFSKVEYELPIGVFLVVKAVYTFDIMRLFLPVTVLLLSSAFAAYVFGKILRRTAARQQPVAVLIIALFLASPASTTLLRLDGVTNQSLYYLQVLFAVCFLGAVLCAGDSRNTWRIPLLCFVGTAANPLFVLWYLPLVLMMLIHRRLFVKDSRKDMLLAFLSIAGALAAFFLFRQEATGGVCVLGADPWRELASEAIRYAAFLVVLAAVWLGLPFTGGTESKMTALLALGAGLLPFASMLLDVGVAEALTVAVTALTGYLLYLSGVPGGATAHLENTAKRMTACRLPVVLAVVYTAIFAFV